jgi:hypothetical protein
MKKIVCNIKNATDADKILFKNYHCLLLISVGQEAHEGERFLATINLINTSFKSCVISLYDSLQRYTMALNSVNTPDFFHNAAVEEGNAWIARNKKYYDMLNIPTQISRWDDWLKHSSFEKQKQEIKLLIDNDPTYKSSFDMAVNKYLDRYCFHLKENNDFDIHRARKLCFDYVLEECVVLCLWTELLCPVEIYPNAHNEAIEDTRRRFIIPKYPNLLRALTLRFRNAKQLSPQQFVTLV